MTEQPASCAPSGSVVAQLMAAVRPEFRVDRLFVAVDDPILGGGGPCRVPHCERTGHSAQLCHAHYVRWKHQGRPELATFVVTTNPATKGHGYTRPCGVDNCGRGRAHHGLCNRHHKAWVRTGEPPVGDWLSVAPPADPDDEPCAMPGCRLSAEPRQPGSERPRLCISHRNRWYGHGRPSLAELIERCAAYGEPMVDFSELPAQLRLEVQYGTQCRVDDHTIRLPARSLTSLIRFLADCGRPSLLGDADRLDHLLDGRFRVRSTERAFVRYTIQRLCDLLEGEGWEREYTRDRWQLNRLGFEKSAGGQAVLRFDRITLPWLRELGKRYARLRLTTGISPDSVGGDVLALTRLSGVLVDAAGETASIDQLDREVLERYLAWLRAQGNSLSFQRGHTASVMTFLHTVRRYDWAPELPAEAMIYPDDYPPQQTLVSRGLSEHVMQQIEDPANLDEFADSAMRVMTELLIRTGLRGGDARKLPIDCLVRDDDGACYLRYINHKPAREAYVPIDDALEARIVEQQQRVRARWAQAAVCLFPAARNNPSGRTPVGRAHYVNQLARWIRLCDIRDETGALVHVTPHQFRHTYGTRLINSGVPEEVVRKLLDHDSPDMTAHYARLQLKTIRREWEKARKVNIAGERLTVDGDGPLADAAWMKENLGRAKQALPNGYCGLPLQQTCPHANACLTCPVFITTAEFLPQHREQRENTLALISAAQIEGQERMVEMNHQVLSSLDNIITALEAPDSDQTGETADGR